MKNKGSVPYVPPWRDCSGFVILFAITISSILLAIALGVVNIALKEVKFSTNVRDTNEAFFAADAGVESALFQDKNNNICSPAPCNFSFAIAQLGSAEQSCVKVTVEKTTTLNTIISKGYNTGDASCESSNSGRIERELKVTYGAPPTYTKIFIHEDYLSQQNIDMSSAGTVDGNTSTYGFDTDNSPAGALIKIDLGYSGGPAESAIRARFYLNDAGYAGNYNIRYSINTSEYAGTAVSGFVPSLDGWNEVTWDSIGPYRYWWLTLENTPEPGPDIYEFELYK